MTPTLKARPLAYWAFLILAHLALMAMLFADLHDLSLVLVARAAGLAAVVTMFLLVRAIQGPMRRVWGTFWAYLLCTVLGDVIYDVQGMTLGDVPSPGLSDGIYLACYAFAFIGLAWLNRIAEPHGNRRAGLDSAVIGLAILAVVGFFVIQPQSVLAEEADLTFLMSMAYPVLDVFVLAAMIRGFLVPGRRSPAHLALTAAMAIFLILDLIYNYAAATGISIDTEVPWLAAIALLTLSPALRGAAHVSALSKAEVERITLMRALVVAAAALTAPALATLAAATGDSHAILWLVPMGGLIIALVVLRVYLAMRPADPAPR